MNTDFLFVAREIALEINEGIRTWLGDEYLMTPDSSPQIKRHLNSLIIRYEVTGPRKIYLLAKIPFKSSLDNLQVAINDENLRKAAQDEFSLLCRIQEVFNEEQDSPFDTIHPLVYLEPWNAILMEEVAARSLLSFIHKSNPIFSTSDHKLFMNNLVEAVKWLKHYHQHVGEYRSGQQQRELLRIRYDKISQDCCNHLMVTKATAYLPRLEVMMKKCHDFGGIARMHGDFHCNNILITSGNRVCVIDPRTNADKQPVYHDLASLVVHLHYYQMRGNLSRRFLRQCQTAIIQAYFQSEEFSRPLFNFYCASEVLFKWAIKERDLRKLGRSKFKTVLTLPFIHFSSIQILHRFLF